MRSNFSGRLLPILEKIHANDAMEFIEGLLCRNKCIKSISAAESLLQALSPPGHLGFPSATRPCPRDHQRSASTHNDRVAQCLTLIRACTSPTPQVKPAVGLQGRTRSHIWSGTVVKIDYISSFCSSDPLCVPLSAETSSATRCTKRSVISEAFPELRYCAATSPFEYDWEGGRMRGQTGGRRGWGGRGVRVG